MKLLLASSLLLGAANAFTTNLAPTMHHTKHSSSSSSLNAAGGAPQYEKIQATLRQAETVADGSCMLHIDTLESIDYEPGHVLALEIQPEAAEDDDDVSATAEQDVDSKTYKDTQDNGGWMRGPYTVSRSTSNSLDILIKVVGEKSKRFSTAKPGTPLQFGGKFKVPILEGVSVEATERVVMISTGVGVGPCIGAIEKALEGAGGDGESSSSSFPPIDLIASYRTKDEIIYKDHLDKLQQDHSDKFAWKSVVTSEQGRLSSSEDNLKAITETTFNDADIKSTHYHLIGNGQLVSEFKAGLEKAGVPEDKVTVEMYFNHKAEVRGDVVDRIAAAVMETSAVAV